MLQLLFGRPTTAKQGTKCRGRSRTTYFNCKSNSKRKTKSSGDREDYGDSKPLQHSTPMRETAHLGKFADEKRMPRWLSSKLNRGGHVRTEGVVPVLVQLLQQDTSVARAFTCNPNVAHISKLRREGGFCGYRNIQCLISYIISSNYSGCHVFENAIPSVFQIQDLIETAWAEGYGSSGKAETGGIRGTRKYIGTPEAHALFRSLGIPCTVKAIRRGNNSWRYLLGDVHSYFAQGGSALADQNVQCTTLPPIYLQHKGHSLTIVGITQDSAGLLQLLVFDPSSHDPEKILTSADNISKRKQTRRSPPSLQPYYRGEDYLCRYDEFELLLYVGLVFMFPVSNRILQFLPLYN